MATQSVVSKQGYTADISAKIGANKAEPALPELYKSASPFDQLVLPENRIKLLFSAAPTLKDVLTKEIESGLTEAQRKEIGRYNIDYKHWQERTDIAFLNDPPPDINKYPAVMERDRQVHRAMAQIDEKARSAMSPEDRTKLDVQIKQWEKRVAGYQVEHKPIPYSDASPSGREFQQFMDRIAVESKAFTRSALTERTADNNSLSSSMDRLEQSDNQLRQPYKPRAITPGASPAQKLAEKFEGIAATLGVAQDTIDEKRREFLAQSAGNKSDADIKMAEYCAQEIKQRISDPDFRDRTKMLAIAKDLQVENKWMPNTVEGLREKINKGIDQYATLAALEAMDKGSFTEDWRYADKSRLAEKIEFLRSTYELNAKSGEYTQGITRGLAGALGMKNSYKESIGTVSNYVRLMLAKSGSGEFSMNKPYEILRNASPTS